MVSVSAPDFIFFGEILQNCYHQHSTKFFIDKINSRGSIDGHIHSYSRALAANDRRRAEPNLSASIVK